MSSPKEGWEWMPTDQDGITPTQRREAPLRLGRYDLLAKIASGGMASVYLARQRGLQSFEKAVVVKTIHPQLAEEQRFVDMFLDEARISALLKHPNCVDVYDVGCEEGVHFIAMEYLPGQALKEFLREGHDGRPLDVASAASIIASAAEALDAAHNLRTMTGEALELVHRDVSPANIMVTYDGRVKLLDFGISKARGRITQTESNTLKGKLGYMAPEVLHRAPIDRRTDIFSLGVVMWESLALRPLFLGDNEAATVMNVVKGQTPPPSQFRAEIPPALDAICLRALAPNPVDRYQTAREMYADIVAALPGDIGFARQKIAAYMDEVFCDLRRDEEQLLRDAFGERGAIAPPVGSPLAEGSLAELNEETHQAIHASLSHAAATESARSFQLPLQAPESESESLPRRLASASIPPALDTRPVDPARWGATESSFQDFDSQSRASGSVHPPATVRTGGRGAKVAAIVAFVGFAIVGFAVLYRAGWAIPRALTESVTSPGSATRAATAGGEESTGPDGNLQVISLDDFGRPREVPERGADESDESNDDESKDSAQERPADDADNVATIPAAAHIEGRDEQGEHKAHVADRGDKALTVADERAAEKDKVADAATADSEVAAGRALKLKERQQRNEEARQAAAKRAAVKRGKSSAPAGAGPDKTATRSNSPKKKGGTANRQQVTRRQPAPKKRDPEEAKKRFQAGQRAFFRGNIAVAKKEFQAAVDAAPDFAPAYRGLGLVYERQGNKTAARRVFNRYLRLAPDAGDSQAIRKRLERL